MSKKSFDGIERASTSNKFKTRSKSSKNAITTFSCVHTYGSRDKVTKSDHDNSREKETSLEHELDGISESYGKSLHQIKAQIEQLNLGYGSSLPEIETKYNLPMRNNFFCKEVCNDTKPKANNSVFKKNTSLSKEVLETKRNQKRRVHKSCTFNRNISSSSSPQVNTCGVQSQTRGTVQLLDDRKNVSKNASLHIDSSTVDSEYQSEISNTSVDIFKKPRRFYRRKNKIKPQSASSSNSTKSSSSQKLNTLILKYYEDTPDFSSYSFSTLSPNISSSVSNSTRETSPKSITNLEILPAVSKITSVVSSPIPVYKFVKNFDPSYASSLDIPRKGSALVSFPPLTKITTSIYYLEDLVADNEGSIDDTKSFRNVAEVSASITKYSLINHSIHNNMSTDTEKTVNNKNEISFYTNSSTDSADAEEHLNKVDLFTTVDSEEEQLGRCSCICNWIFPKNRRRYFS